MRYFQNLKSFPPTFWAIGLEEDTITVRSGEIGSEERSPKDIRTFESSASARREHDRLIADVLRQGYQEMAGLAPVPPPASPITDEQTGSRGTGPSPVLGDKTGLITRLDRWLRANRPDFYSKVKPGATEKQFDEWVEKWGAQRRAGMPPGWMNGLPPTFREFYHWSNGQQGSDIHEEAFISGLYLKSLEDMFVGQPTKGAVTYMDGGSMRTFHSIDMLGLVDGPEGRRPGQIVSSSADDVSGRVEYPSFDKWLQVLVTALEDGLYEVEESDDGFCGLTLKTDNGDGLDVIRQRICPGYPGAEISLRDIWV